MLPWKFCKIYLSCFLPEGPWQSSEPTCIIFSPFYSFTHQQPTMTRPGWNRAGCLNSPSHALQWAAGAQSHCLLPLRICLVGHTSDELNPEALRWEGYPNSSLASHPTFFFLIRCFHEHFEVPLGISRDSLWGPDSRNLVHGEALWSAFCELETQESRDLT